MTFRISALFAAILTTVAVTGAAHAADAEAGMKVFGKCKACHMVKANGKHTVGPNLHGVVGRKAGSAKGFRYSKAMAESGLTWDEATLDKFLLKPKDLVNKTRMAFPGLKKDEDRANVIAYLKSLTN
ncbi:MAG: cytochrome c family protein [Rhodospirillaceae bacterium]